MTWDRRFVGGGFGDGAPPIHMRKDYRVIQCVYFIQAKPSGLVKIGYTKDLHRRMAQLQYGSAEDLQLLGILRDKSWETERDLHSRLDEYRVHGEWFQPSEPVLGLASGELVLTIGGIRPAKRLAA